MHEEEKSRPTALHAERTILGAMLLEPSAVEESILLLTMNDFALDSHRRIFRSIESLQNRGMGVDTTTVIEDLKKHKEIDSVGGLPYLLELTSNIPRKLRIDSYAQDVIEKAKLREIIAIGDSALNAAADEGEESSQIIASAMERMQQVAESGADSRMERMGDYLNHHYPDSDQVFAVSKRDTGISSGWRQYDEWTNGFHRDELTIVAARPSMGKTAWAGSLADNVARAQQKRVLIFILEQAKRSLMARLLCGRAQASLTRFAKGESTTVERQYIKDAMEEFRHCPLYWDDRTQMTATTIRAKVSRIRRELPEEDILVMVDQLSHMGSADVYRKGMQRDEIAGAKALALKTMCKQLHVPTVLFAQLNRGVKNNKDFRPTLTDLAESGQLEQHADNIIFLHRPEYYDKSDETLRGKAEEIFAKQRDGATGSCMVKYIAESCRWKDEEPIESTDRIPW